MLMLFTRAGVELSCFSSKMPVASKRPCYSRASDWENELLGEWRIGTSRCAAFSCHAANRTAQQARVVDDKASQRWHRSACFAEDTVHSCVFHGDARASNLARLVYEPHDCALLPVDGHVLARQHAGARIIFLGDSMMRHLFVSFVCQLAVSLAHRRPAAISWVGPHDSSSPPRGDAAHGRQNGWNSLSNCPFEENEHCYATSGCVFFEGLGDICLVVKTAVPRLALETTRELFRPCGTGS